MAHYHIRWSGKTELDWEAFGSRAEAEASARQLVRSGETYAIEERSDEACTRCSAAYQSKTANAPEARGKLKYSWQQAVLDALAELRTENLILKINQAQRALSARLCDLTPPDVEEQLAIRDALQNLRVLMEESKPAKQSGAKREIA